MFDCYSHLIFSNLFLLFVPKNPEKRILLCPSFKITPLVISMGAECVLTRRRASCRPSNICWRTCIGRSSACLAADTPELRVPSVRPRTATLGPGNSPVSRSSTDRHRPPLRAARPLKRSRRRTWADHNCSRRRLSLETGSSTAAAAGTL